MLGSSGRVLVSARGYCPGIPLIVSALLLLLESVVERERVSSLSLVKRVGVSVPQSVLCKC